MTLPSPSSSTPTATPATSLPAVAAPPAPAAFVPATTPVRFPLDWIVAHAAPPIRFRALTEVARLNATDAEKVAALPFTHRPSLLLAMLQQPDGTWGGGMLSIPSSRAEHFEGIGTIPAVRRLIEYGWHKDTPPLVHARRVLFRLLAEDDDPSFLFELGGKHAPDEESVKRGRSLLREAAAATLAQAGYEGDPRLRGAARRILNRMADYLRSPLAQKPFIRQGNQHMLAAEACPPSIYAVTMLAYMPLFRAEHHREMDALYQHLTQPQPRQEAVQLCGKQILPVPHLVLGDYLPHRNAADADVPFALYWLELMARLGFLKRNENWCRLFERFLEDRDREGVWHPHKGMAVAKSASPHVWPTYPLEAQMAGEERWTDITFRLGLIARLIGRPIEIV
ncbi:MAG: hypothetical protein ABIT20_03715 [Gemmatimonadaceae bacterium]